MTSVSYTHLDVYKRQVQEIDESRGRDATDAQCSSGSLGRAKDKHGGWRKTEYSGSNGGYKGVASEKTVTTATAPKIKK